MNEKQLDSNVNEYKSSNYVKRLQWNMFIVPQKIDNLKLYKYLKKLLEQNVELRRE